MIVSTSLYFLNMWRCVIAIIIIILLHHVFKPTFADKSTNDMSHTMYLSLWPESNRLSLLFDVDVDPPLNDHALTSSFIREAGHTGDGVFFSVDIAATAAMALTELAC
jgi:hypothetical protein